MDTLWKVIGKVDGERVTHSNILSQDLQDFLLEEVKRLYPGNSGKIDIDYRMEEIVLRATSDQGTTILRCYKQKEETK